MDWPSEDGADVMAVARSSARVSDRAATGWIAARSTLIAVHRGDHRQVMHDAAYAVAISGRGQLGSTLGNALAASTAARLGDRDAVRSLIPECAVPVLLDRADEVADAIGTTQ